MDATFLQRAQASPVMIPTMIDDLTRNGFDLNGLSDGTGRTALQDTIEWLQSAATIHIAILSITEILRDSRVDLNVHAVDGTTALHTLMNLTFYSFNQQAILQVLDRLLEHDRANPNLPAADGRVVLHTLVNQTIYSYNQEAVVAAVNRLLQRGANPNLQAADGTTVVHTLMDQMIYPYNRLAILTTLQRLLEHGASPNLQSPDGRTLLHSLLDRRMNSNNRQGIMAAIALLLENGANPQLQDDKGQTALHILAKTRKVCLYEKPEILIMFQEHGADITAVKDNDGYLPLHYLGKDPLFDPTVAFLMFRQMFNAGFYNAG